MQLDTDIYNNKKIVRMETKFGHLGFSFAVKMLCRVFSDSYFLAIDDDEISVICRKILYVTLDEFDEMLAFSLDINLFDKKKYETYRILTSAGIQKKYFDIGKDSRWRHLHVVKEYISKKIDLKEYDHWVVNMDGHVVGEKYEAERSKKIVKNDKKPEPQPEQKPEAPSEPQPGIRQFTYSDVLQFMKVDYKSRDEDFKKTYTKEEFDDYIWLNQRINKKYDGIRISTQQLRFEEYVEFIEESSPSPSLDELDCGFRKMAELGIQNSTDIYLRLEQCLKMVKEGEPKLVPFAAFQVPMGLNVDQALLEDIKVFWTLGEVRNPLQHQLVCYFINELDRNKELDIFKTQYEAYKQFTRIRGIQYRFHIENFIDKKEDNFLGGKWRSENWVLRLKQELKGKIKTNGKESRRGYTPENGYGEI